MKEKVCYDPKNDCIWLCMKDDRTIVNRKCIQAWWCFNGKEARRPKTTELAKKMTGKMVELESAPYLDQYRDFFS